MDKTTIQIGRLEKKLRQRDRKIAGLLHYISRLETALSHTAISVQRLPIDLERAVQRGLSNVHLLPVIGLRSDDKIVEVKVNNG